MRSLCWTLAWTLLLGAADVQAQQAAAPGEGQADEADEADERAFSASLYTYFLPADQDDYAQPTLAADTGDWHVEARYNYEALRTGSLWTGPSFSVGEQVVLDVNLLFGGVFGEARGFAPGFLLTLSWWKLELYSEGEYLFDVASRDDWYFYTWSELTIAPLDWLWLGMVVQRTRAYQSELELQRGVLLGVSYEEFYFTAHVFNAAHDPTVVLALGADW